MVIDDDEKFARRLIGRIEKSMPELGDSSDLVLTEKELRQRLEHTKVFGYSFVILDVMLRWTAFNEEVTEDAPAEIGGYFRAGIRCLAAIRDLEEGRDVPVFIYSAVDPADVRFHLEERQNATKNVKIFGKGRDAERLQEAIREVLEKRHPSR
jgi:hypothetical protein